MKSKRIIVVATNLAVLMFSGSALAQTTWHVDDDNCPAPGAGTSGDPFCSIQVGIDASADGDDVLVSPGTYNETINFNGKAITLHSSEGPEVTIIGATGLNDSVVRCVSGEGPDTILDGLTITGGFAKVNGGGMYIEASSPNIVNCIFRENTIFPQNIAVCGGAGVFVTGGSPVFTSCEFTENFLPPAGQCGSNGAGLFAVDSSPIVSASVFSANESSLDGGGMATWGCGGVVQDSIFVGNTGPRSSAVHNVDSLTDYKSVFEKSFHAGWRRRIIRLVMAR